MKTSLHMILSSQMCYTRNRHTNFNNKVPVVTILGELLNALFAPFVAQAWCDSAKNGGSK